MSMVLVGLFAVAQDKGDMAVGLNLGITPCTESGVSVANFGIGARFQYNVTNPLRLEAAVGYDFKDKEVSVFTAGVNGHWIFSLSEKFNIYPIVGVGVANIKGYVSVDEKVRDEILNNQGHVNTYDNDDISDSSTKFYYNLGAGGEYKITDRLSANIEVKWQGISWFNRVPVSVGVTYKF